MDDPICDDLVPLNRAKIPGNPAAVTRWRWTKRGVRGKRLMTWVVGGRVYTTAAAIADFIVARSDLAVEEPPVPLRSPSRRAREITRAEQDLAAEGI